MSWPKILLKQIINAMMLVLLLALGVSFGIQSWIEAGVIAAVVCLNIVVGFFQEYSAERTMESLRGLSSPSANVIRHGHSKQIPSPELVPGDLIEVPTVHPSNFHFLQMELRTDAVVENGRYRSCGRSHHRMYELRN